MYNTDQLFSMKDKVVLVTGAASGMGERFAHVLAGAGARVVCAARRLDKVSKVASDIVASGGDAIAFKLDITQTDNIKPVFDEIEKNYGLVDVLVNCAGQLIFQPFPDINDDDWNNLVNVNLTGSMRMSREFSQRLIAAEKPGCIVNISSVTGMQTMKNVPCYGSVKAAMNQLTRQIAVDLFDKGIRCNAIAPGYFKTEMSDPFLDTEEAKAMEQTLPIKRIGKLEELDGVLLLLASDASSYINVAIIPVDSGQNIQLA